MTKHKKIYIYIYCASKNISHVVGYNFDMSYGLMDINTVTTVAYVFIIFPYT